MIKDHPRPRIHRIHNPLLRGRALLLQPDGLLVRWPDLVPVPAIGEEFTGTAVHVPPEILETVLTLLLSRCALARCDAAKRLADNKRHRARILERLFSRTYVQKMLASAARLDPEQRERLKAEEKAIAVRRLFEATSTTRPQPDDPALSGHGRAVRKCSKLQRKGVEIQPGKCVTVTQNRRSDPADAVARRE